ncbi:MAG: hypothetical protein CR975_02110 [Gammaproteobacteria bacterium]|nr:MAG: hypothetical protein CR975_02110 [Gammaproteobacteria bacterium]
MTKITDAARQWLATLLLEKPIYLAWGEGLPTWDNDDKTTEVLEGLTGLENEIARRRIAITGYVVPDSNGDIQTPDGNYRLSAEPTNFLYFKCVFDFADDTAATIRELGIFIDGSVDDSLPAGQQYFTPEQVTEPGVLFGAARFSDDIVRNATTRHIFEFVLPILS